MNVEPYQVRSATASAARARRGCRRVCARGARGRRLAVGTRHVVAYRAAGSLAVGSATSTTAATTATPTTSTTTTAPTVTYPIAPPATAAPPSITPVTLAIPAIGVDAVIVPVGVVDGTDGSRSRRSRRSVGTSFDASPGDAGSAVLLGHIDGGGRPGVFYDLATLELGAEVHVGWEKAARSFRVIGRGHNSRRRNSRPISSDVTYRRGSCSSRVAVRSTTTSVITATTWLSWPNRSESASMVIDPTVPASSSGLRRLNVVVVVCISCRPSQSLRFRTRSRSR